MPLTVPASVNYPTKLVAVPSLMQDEPKEGRKQISVEVDWQTMGGTANSVSFNLQNNATLEWTQISTLKIDNSNCGADITFVFPDTSDTISVPAYAPYVLVPVFSNGKSFYAIAPNAVDGDITRFQILNYEVDPTNIPTATGQEPAFNSSAPLILMSAGAASAQIIPAGVSGTVTGIYIGAVVDTTSVATSVTAALVDGDGNTLGRYMNALDASQGFNGTVFAMSNLDMRFSDGLQFNQGPGNDIPDGNVKNWTVYVFYRTNGG